MKKMLLVAVGILLFLASIPLLWSFLLVSNIMAGESTSGIVLSLLPLLLAAAGITLLYKNLNAQHELAAGLILLGLGILWIYFGFGVMQFIVPMVAEERPSINAGTLLSGDFSTVETHQERQGENILPFQLVSYGPGAIGVLGGILLMLKRTKTWKRIK